MDDIKILKDNERKGLNFDMMILWSLNGMLFLSDKHRHRPYLVYVCVVAAIPTRSDERKQQGLTHNDTKHSRWIAVLCTIFGECVQTECQ